MARRQHAVRACSVENWSTALCGPIAGERGGCSLFSSFFFLLNTYCCRSIFLSSRFLRYHYSEYIFRHDRISFLFQVFSFDKGCTFIVIFGLPGQKHEDDAIRALKCAHSIYESLHAMQEISHESIGVTTGMAFCGVVGHKNRHEYTVRRLGIRI